MGRTGNNLIRQFIWLQLQLHQSVMSTKIIVSILMFTIFSAFPSIAQPFADEDRDWGITPVQDIRQSLYSAPTPTNIPGAKPVSTRELHDMLLLVPTPILIDVAGGNDHETVRGAVWLPGFGRGDHFFDPLQARLAEILRKLSSGDKARPLVFFCVNARCWLSYNASLRAASLGYSQVFWYRGGIAAWREAGLPLAKVSASAE